MPSFLRGGGANVINVANGNNVTLHDATAAWPAKWPKYAAVATVGNTSFLIGGLLENPETHLDSAIAVRPTGSNAIELVGNFEPIDAGFAARQYAAACSDGTDIYITGGRTDSTVGYGGYAYTGGSMVVYKEAWKCSTSMACVQLPEMQTERFGHQMVFFRGSVWVIGGDTGPTLVNSVERLTASSTWTPEKQLPLGMAEFAAAVVSDRIIVAGGMRDDPGQGSSDFKAAYVFDGIAWTETAPLVPFVAAPGAIVALSCGKFKWLDGWRVYEGTVVDSSVVGPVNQVLALQGSAEGSAMVNFEPAQCAPTCSFGFSYWVQPQQENPDMWNTNAMCVPTAAGNLITYLRPEGAHGYNINNHLDKWNGVSKHDLTDIGNQKFNDELPLSYLGDAIDLGDAMNTDWAAGTTIENARKGLQSHLDATNVLGERDVVGRDRPDAIDDPTFLDDLEAPFLMHIASECVNVAMWAYTDGTTIDVDLLNSNDGSPEVAGSTLGHTIAVQAKLQDCTTNPCVVIGYLSASGLDVSRNAKNERGCDAVMVHTHPENKCVVGTTHIEKPRQPQKSTTRWGAVAGIIVAIVLLTIGAICWVKRDWLAAKCGTTAKGNFNSFL